MPKTLVEMKDISKSFPGVKALDNAQLTLYEGEVLGLLGENGAGKSTLMNVLGGIYRPDSGTITIDGQEAVIHSVLDAQKLGVAFIHQEIALVPYLSVAENIFLGRERKTAGMVDKRKMYEEARQWLEVVGLDVNPATMVCRLSIGKQQMVEIAKACSLNMKLLIMDEPTSSLSEREVESLFQMIRRLQEKGIGIIYISHKLSEIFTITDRVCVMRDGSYVGTIITKESTEADLVQMMVGRELNNYYVRTFNKPGDVVLEVENINSGKRLKDCSFQVRKGEILGFYGLVGAGRSELLKAVMGLYPKDSGKVLLNGEDISRLPTLKIQSRGMALVPENRKLEGLILKNSISFNMSISVLPKFINHLHVNYRKEKEIVDGGIAALAIKTPSREQRAVNLSGGNQQKVVLAKWLAADPKILISDLAGELGLSGGVQVVAGSHDHISNALGCGVWRQGSCADTMGMTEGFTAVLKREQLPGENVEKYQISCEPFALPGLYNTVAWNNTAGVLLRWFVREFVREDGEDILKIFARLNGEMAKEPPPAFGAAALFRRRHAAYGRKLQRSGGGINLEYQKGRAL